MLHSASAIVKIDSEPDRGYFTDGDVVSGSVLVHVRREINIEYITAQLVCQDRAQIYRSERQESHNMYGTVAELPSVHLDEHTLLWESEREKFETSSTKGVLAKGDHSFPFTFRLPECAEGLPSSYSVDEHDDNGVYWGVHAFISRDSRVRSNYQAFGNIRMLPMRHRSFSGQESSYTTTSHAIDVKLVRRPSFLQRNDTVAGEVRVEGRLAVPSGGITQSRTPVDKDSPELPEIRLAIRASEPDQVVIKEIILFIDTNVITSVHGRVGNSEGSAIAFSQEQDEVVRGDGTDWQDLTHIIAHARVYGLPETWKTKLHDVRHVVRAQVMVAPARRPTRISILEIKEPVTLLSEAVTTNGAPGPPPYTNQ